MSETDNQPTVHFAPGELDQSLPVAAQLVENDPKQETFDIEDLRLGEIATVERISGQSIKSLSSKNAPQGLTMQAIIMVVKQRTNPKFNLGDAAQVSLKEFNLILGDGKKKNKKKDAAKN